MYITIILRGKRNKEWKNDEADNPKPGPWWSAQALSQGLALEVCASCRHSKIRPATISASRANFGSWGMSWMCSMPRSTRELEIPMTNYDSCHLSVAQSSLIPTSCTWASSSSTDRSLIPTSCTWASSSSTDRSRPSEGHRPHASSFSSITSCTTRSITYRQRRICHSSNIRL
jgi:hypothetical protein